MIIFFNLTLVILFFFKSFFYKNEFSLIKTVYRRFKESIKLLSGFLWLSESFSFKKFTKIYFLIKSKLSHSTTFSLKKIIYIYYILNAFKSKWFLIQLLESRTDSTNTLNFNFSKSKLNAFLMFNAKTALGIFVKTFNTVYTVKFRPSSFVKYSTNSVNVLFLRKNKIFNKGRYSRNRQLYRTGVYWCIWLSVFLGYCLYFSFYRFTLNFGYQWWLIFGFLFLFINQKMFKYNFYNIKIILNEIKKNFNWISLISYNFFKKIIRN